MLDLPTIGQEYTWQEILEIAKSRGLTDVVEILTYGDSPDHPFVSDGCSCCPELWNGVLITPYCVAHDLRYWCGLPGDKKSRLKADIRLMELVAKATGDYEFARGMFIAISTGGKEGTGLPWEWGYGRSK